MLKNGTNLLRLGRQWIGHNQIFSSLNLLLGSALFQLGTVDLGSLLAQLLPGIPLPRSTHCRSHCSHSCISFRNTSHGEGVRIFEDGFHVGGLLESKQSHLLLQDRILGRFSQLDHAADSIRSVHCRAESFHDFRRGLPTEELFCVELIDLTDLVPLRLTFWSQGLEGRFCRLHRLLYLCCLGLHGSSLLTVGHLIGRASHNIQSLSSSCPNSLPCHARRLNYAGSSRTKDNALPQLLTDVLGQVTGSVSVITDSHVLGQTTTQTDTTFFHSFRCHVGNATAQRDTGKDVALKTSHESRQRCSHHAGPASSLHGSSIGYLITGVFQRHALCHQFCEHRGVLHQGIEREGCHILHGRVVSTACFHGSNRRHSASIGLGLLNQIQNALLTLGSGTTSKSTTGSNSCFIECPYGTGSIGSCSCHSAFTCGTDALTNRTSSSK